jgi:predicted enzyme related to lactoylglutathione lyase
MKLTHVDTILLVENIENSRSFYSGILGLEMLHDWQTMLVYKERLALLQTDALCPVEEAQKFIQPGPQGRGNVVIYFQSDELEACYKKLSRAGVEILHGIIELPWERVFRIYDPDRYVIEIGEPH